MDDMERLRRLSVNDESAFGDESAVVGSAVLDPRSAALARLAALVAVSAGEPSIRSAVDDAVGSGLTASEIVDVLGAVLPVVGRPRVVTAAPRIARALHEDLDLLEDA